jgi:sulfite reductase (NADPH) hemoprotein beta-component
MADDLKLSANEAIKEASRGLRGTLAEGLTDLVSGAIAEDDQQLVKFHGMYLQDDRDLRPERTAKKLDKAFSFMLRLRIPGGVVTPEQWLRLDAIARDYAGDAIRLTTRQTVQFHGVIKGNLRATMQAIDSAALDTLAACGDVNRNVLASTNPHVSVLHAAAYELAGAISAHLLPQTGAYREIWLEGDPVIEAPEPEPVYGRTYLPRKFKAVVAVPPDNDVDVFAQDLGFIAITDEAGALAGWNVTAGGGMGMTHGEPETFPRLADVLGFVAPDAAIAVAEAVVTTQRDWGDRTNRRHARLKYTIETHGLDAFRAEVERRAGVTFQRARPFTFGGNGDRLGWVSGEGGRQNCTLFVEGGRLRDVPGGPQWLAATAALAELLAGWPGAEFRATANQNLMLANLPPEARREVEALLGAHGIAPAPGAIRANSMACVALPTCGLALAEAERFLPGLITRIEAAAEAAGVGDQPITLRMTGCPNGCARPYIAEIGFVGRGPGRYNLYLGGAPDGSRLSKLYAADVDEAAILSTLSALFADYAATRSPSEPFGDWVIRRGHVAETRAGREFHADTGPKLALAA